MKHFLLLFLLLSLTATAQRSLPYPIILIHGLNGNGVKSWSDLNSYFKLAGLTVESKTLDYDLNANKKLETSNKLYDVAQIPPYTLGNYDVYAINFDTGDLSNQSGVVKQGYALKFAIQRVLNATGATKVVLLGHSMGGLAAREYIQNPENWQDDGRHHVAKLVTLGTPHGGSNLGSDGYNVGVLFGYDERSEAVRDLRRDYKNDKPGVYLFGGYETSSYIQRGSFGDSYYNLDVNSNGQIGDQIIGLNQKDISTNLAYACIIGKGVPGFLGDSDGVVLIASQSLSGRYNNFNVDLFYHQCEISDGTYCHPNEPKKATLPIMQGLDEPETNALAYEINVTSTALRRGFFTVQANANTIDTDRYKFSVSQGGLLTIDAKGYQDALSTVVIRDSNGDRLSTVQGPTPNATVNLPAGGVYYIDFIGSSRGTYTSYVYATSFCPLPPAPTIVYNGATTFCEGGNLTLSTNAVLDNYQWVQNTSTIGNNTNAVSVGQSGSYSLRTSACGTTVASANSINVQVNPIPEKPLISIQSQPFGLLATSATNYQWYVNAQKIAGATNPLFTAVSSGAYSVRTTVLGCSSESQLFTITGTEEELTDLVNVYPNPSTGSFTVELPVKTDAVIELLDLNGKVVYQNFDKAKTTRKIVDTHSASSGIYLLKVKYGEREVRRKIIIHQ